LCVSEVNIFKVGKFGFQFAHAAILWMRIDALLIFYSDC
jgi:hypothetical protein